MISTIPQEDNSLYVNSIEALKEDMGLTGLTVSTLEDELSETNKVIAKLQSMLEVEKAKAEDLEKSLKDAISTLYGNQVTIESNVKWLDDRLSFEEERSAKVDTRITNLYTRVATLKVVLTCACIASIIGFASLAYLLLR